MKNLGSINGKIEVLISDTPIDSDIKNVTANDLKQIQVALIASSNYVEFTPEEALDLADVISYAATNQMHLLPECQTFKRKV